MSLDKKLFSIASSAVEKQQNARDARNPVSKGLDIATNKSYANEDKKVAAAALRQWENNTWKPKVEAKLKQEIKKRAPHLKPGTKAYQQTYDSLFNKNYKDLQAAKASAQQQIGTLRKPKQSQRQLDNEYRQNESIRNNTVGLQAAAHTARDTGEAVSGALATGTSRALRYPLQLAADVGENDDGGIFDRGAKALERHEDNLQQVYPAYADIQQNGNFGQKLALSAVEQIPNLALSFTGAGAAAKGAQLAGAGAKMTAATAYGTAAATMYPQAYGDGNDSTKQELENATPEQLATAVRSKDIYKGHFDKNVKAGMSEDEAYQKARDQTVSSIAEESGDAVGLVTLALSMLAPGVGSFTANRAAGGAVSKWGQKVFNTLAVKADAGKVAKIAIPAAVGAGIVGLNIAEEGLQEGFTDYTAQKAAVDVGVKDKIDTAQTKEAVLMGGILGGAMGGGVYVGTRNSKLHQAQDDLKAAQQAYAEVAGQIPQLQQQIEAVSPRSPEGQALTARVEEIRAALDAMAAEAEKASIPRTSLARRAPRIEPTNSAASDFDGQVDGATELDDQGFENALNPDGTPATQAPVVQPMSEAELDAQDAQLAELIAEQAALDEAIEDGSNEKPLEESIAAAQSWYDSKRGEGKQGLAGVVSRAAATEQDAAFAQQQEAIKGTTTSINDYIASERAKQQQIEAQLQQEAQAATTDAEKQAVAQKIEQREINRAKEDELLSSREQLAQPYENESFDTTVIAADGTPFKLARFWDSSLPATAKAKAIAEAFGGQVEQNVAKSDWANLPEGVQKELHQWFTERLDGVRQSREGGEQTAEQEVAPTASGLTMPVRAEQVPVKDKTALENYLNRNGLLTAEQEAAGYTLDDLKADVASNYQSNPQGMVEATKRAEDAGIPKTEINQVVQETLSEQVGWTKPVQQPAAEQELIAPAEDAPVAEVDSTPAATQLTDENPVINIPAPTQAKAETPAPTTDEGIYKSKPAAKAAIKKQKLDPDSVTIKQVKGGGFEIVPNAPAKPSYAQAQEQAASELGLSLDENGEYGGTDAEFEVFANRVDEIQGRSLSNSTPTPQQNSVAPTVPTDDVAIGKDGQAKWFGSNDKAQAFISKKGLSDTHEVVSAGKSRFEIQPKAESIPQADVAKAETVSEIDSSNDRSVSDIALSFVTKEDRIESLDKMSKNISQVAKDNGRAIRVNSDWYKKAYDDASRTGGLIKGESYGSRNLKGIAGVSIAAGEIDGAIRFVMNDSRQQPSKPKNITDEQFAELTSSRTTPSTPTGGQSAPAKRAEAKKAATEKSQNDVTAEAKSRFADNKLFTEDKVAAARARLKSKLTQVNSGLDPEILMDGMTLAGAYIESGVRKFGDYAKMMIEDVGVEVKPYLLSFWEGTRHYPGLDTTGMTNPEESKREFDKLNAEVEQASEPIAPAKPKYPQTVGSGPQMKTFVGENQSGLPLYENKSGVRAIEEYGIFNNETVSITPTGIEQQPREDRYLTKEELAAKKDNNNDAGTSNQDDRQRADGELSTADQADAESRNTGRAEAELTSDVPNIDGRSNRSDTNDGDEAGQSAGKNKRATSTDSRSRTGSTQSNDGANAKSAKSVAVKATDYAIPPRDENAKQPSWFEIGEHNVEIIELVQELESEGRHATPDEQALLADYKGWGSSKIEIFPHPTKGYSSPRWEALGEKLKSLLTDSEYATARRTTQYAHYTPPSVVNGIYSALEQFGFKGGQVFEPASGIGVFNGLMPRDMASKSHYVGVELDPMTALIAKHLYPLSDMSMGDYTKVKLPDNHFDVAVGNPPFADISFNYGAGKNKKPYLIHDYFFAKTLDKLKPGGVMAFVTSKGSMDKTNAAARESFAEQADLIGAIRLPNTAFKDEAGTAVVTDIIFLRKRMPSEASNGVKWTDTKEKVIDGEKISINEYFIDNPNMVLGRNAITSGPFGPTYTVESDSNNLASQIEAAVAQLPKDIFTPARGTTAEAAKVNEIDYGIKGSEQREGGVYVKDGKLMKVIDGIGKPLTHRYGTNGKRIALTDQQIEFLTDYTGVRDAFKQSQQDQLNDNPNWQDSLDKLNTAYDDFVKKHGRMMAHTISTTTRKDGKEITTTRFANKAILFLDVDGYVASALENIVDGEVVGKDAVIEKGSYFKGRTLNKPKVATIKTTQDALISVLNETGKPDIKRIAQLINKTEQEVIDDLGSQVFSNPETGAIEMAEIYLSGNVVEKLEAAEAMAAKDSAYQKNVEALKEAQPAFIAPNDISSNLGSGWIPSETIKQFSQEVLDAGITATYSASAGIWDVSGYSRNSDYQTPDKTTKELMESILNSRPIKVTYTVDGKSFTDSEKTELANQMASKIKKAFKDWIWKDTERANKLAEYYNKNYNNIVPPTFNGDHLTLAGMSSKIKLRPHQKTGIYRVVSQGDVYLNHAVGAGKTFTMIAAAMEEKRLGLINKPMFVVPNHMLAQFSQEFLMLYPAADIVVADEQNFHTHNRKQFVAEISVNNPDAIIITHTAFGKIGVKPETQQKFLEDTLEDWRQALLSTKNMKEGDNTQSVRQLERNIQAMENKLTDLLKAEAKDDTTFFEDMGVDKLIVDEMHEYRKLSYATRQGNIKGITSKGSQMASDLQMKIEIIREKNPTRSIVGASGTPVTNTMGELFSVQSYFQPKQLRKDGLHHFDSWANQFGEVVEGLEQNAAGNYEVVPRFAKFLNVPELMSRVRWFMDVLTSDQLGDVVQRPDIVGGGRQIISVPAPDGFDEFQQSLSERITATRNRSGKPKKGDDNILKIINDGRFGAIDLRFVNPELPSDPNSKLNRAIADMAQAYHDTANNEYHDGKGNVDELTGGAQMLFTNIGLGAQSAASTGFDMKAWINSELIRLGVDPDHIAFMVDANSHAKKGKLFEDMRQGRKRILIGGSNMETGVNAQKRLTHLAHLDSPWYPATVEQREGRIIRQGNQNKEVVIRAYATKGSYDSTMWGMVARKARFIQQAMSGDISMRHMDDISEASAFEQASALSSGDPRALQLAGLAADVERLDRYYSAYENARIENSRNARTSKESIVRTERELDSVNELLSNHKNIETGGVIGKVGNKTFDNRQEFGEAIIKAFDKLKTTQAQGEHVLGTASGYNVVYNGVMLGETFIADADIDIPKHNSNVLFDNNSGEVSATGIATSIINRVNGLAEYKAGIENKIEGLKKDVENFERRANQRFENETERREKREEYDELDRALRDEAAALKAQAAGSNSTTPLTDADRVPNSDSNRPTLDDMPKYSKTNPAKGNTGTTAKQVVSTLQKRFGKDVVAALIKSGKLRVRTLNDFVNADGRLLIPSDAEGFYYDGKVTLIADNLTPETVVATLLHEMGGHAGIQNMLETQTYMSLMENFYTLVRSGNKYAVRAKERAEASAYSDSEARDEYIPYLITEYAQATERGGPLAVIKRFVNRVMAGVRAWVRNHTGVQLKMTPNDMVQLAERMVKRLAEQSMDSVTIAGVENMPAAQMQFSQDSVEQANTPAFREWFDANNPDTRFSRRYSSLGTDGKPVTTKEKARDRVALAQATTMSSKFGINLLLRRHLATPQHVALLNPVFKIFTDNVQARIAYENNEAGLVQTLLPEIWDTRLVVGKKKEAMERVSKAIFDGTMADKVWSDSELQTMFDLTDKDIGFYRRARAAIDTSVMNMTVDTLSSLAKGTKLVNIETIHKLKLQGMHPIMHNLALQQHMTDELEKLAKGGLITPKAEARLQKQLDDVFDVMAAIAMKYDKLVADGYAPLMRFGHYAVEVRDKTTNDLDLFELYETKGQQRKAIKELKERYDETQFTVGTGTLNPEGFKQFKNKGLSPETVQLFAAELGLDDDGAYQAYLKIAVSDRSALKRLIHRKKVPGYSEDMPRVLSAFVMSNARYSGRGLYNSEIERSIQNIDDGNLQNEAQKVFENIENPQEEFAQQRSLMFHYFMGFSPAFLFLNLTQPFTQTIPKLTAYVGAGKGHAYMAQALAMVGKHAATATINMGKRAAGLPTPNWTGFEDNLPAWVKKEDYLRMAREGHLDPQNIYMIKGLERGKGGVASGVWGNIEAAAGWPAEVSESINRRSTMIAAFRVAKDMGDAKLKAKGFDSKYEFAVSIIQQTQGIYNKGNRSGLARGNGKLGQYGPLILVFKQFTINYTEQMIRHGRDKEVKALAVAMMWQFALAGMLGLPFADDLRDLFEGIAYRVFGKAFNLPDYLEGLLGKSNADALMYGIASEKGRIDIHGRSSLGNVIPGTDVIRPGPTDWAEILGASSGFYESFFSAASMAADGKYKDALITASPRYIRDAASGAEIALTGSYRNTKGDKIMDLDKTDAVIKSLAFNPANNARPGRDRSNAYDMKNMLKAKTDYFSKHLAEAIYQDDDARVDALYNEMDAWNERNAEHFNVDIDKIEKSAEKRVERKDFGSAERQNVQDSLALRQEDLAGT